MQLSLDFGDAADASLDLTQFWRRLLSGFGSFGAGGVRLSPMDQLVKSLISSRAHDEDSHATYDRLKFRYPDWNDLADAPMEEVRDLLCPVTYADEKTDWLPSTLKLIRRQTGAAKLDFLGDWTVEQAYAWLQKFGGVEPKVAAAVLNFSRLGMRIMVVDTHVHRVAKRYGLVPQKSTPQDASRILMSLAPDAWTAEDFCELHWLMKRLGQLRCTQSWARCGACPVAPSCERYDVPDRSNISRLHVRPR